MAEYWKSAPRFWCKQCKVFIRDTPFEKTQHEASPKHQNSLRRFLREIHRNNEQQERESQRAKSEVERLRQAVAGGSSKTGNASAPWKKTAAPAPMPAERPVGVEERKKQMAQLAEMGVAIPEEYRRDMALAGEWQTLSETQIDPQAGLEGAAKSIGVRKRKHDGEEDEEEEGGNPSEQLVSKGWGSRMRSYPGAQDGDDEDLDALFASTKDLKRSKVPVADDESEELKSEEQKWDLALSMKKEDEALDSKTLETDSLAQVKAEEIGNTPATVTDEKPSEEAPGPIFKKRKAKVMRK
ncbi:uncharacterized protein N7482_003835 [Penicillium canariense]|uniref:U1-type domain-containing protein n=1 Tax=Penicillium canariense TaxID=189055 RepID=A0A9W9I788_9EURO|nr:uncharacterized protein N7482_003835 [Penicillium canariense]KAJ5168241.1 hypothetical protein N7482_003835 [Penicillium canariense]